MLGVLVIWKYRLESQHNMPVAEEGSVLVSHKNGTVQKQRIVISIEHAVHIAHALKVRHGNNLLSVDVRMKLV